MLYGVDLNGSMQSAQTVRKKYSCHEKFNRSDFGDLLKNFEKI